MGNESTPPLEPNTSSTQDLLLTSLAEFWSLIGPLLDVVQPKTICEIGIGRGQFTRQLLDFCAKNSCHYTGIDALVGKEAFHDKSLDRAQFLKAPSLEVLPALNEQDVYFVDGDHNYYTVLNELRQIRRHVNRWPLIFLHDVGWPWGQRDHYCSPESIPAEFRHDFSTTQGVVPGRSELGDDGFCGEGSDYVYGAADHEDGPRNGVLKAVEDFLREPAGNGWSLITVPGIFGLGILYAPEHCNEEVEAQLAKLKDSSAIFSPLLQTMERNRIALFLTHLKNHSLWNNLKGDYQKLDKAYSDLDKHSAALLGEYKLLLEKYDELHAHYKILFSQHDLLTKRTKP